MPADYRWFSSSCGVSLPIFFNKATVGGGGGTAATGGSGPVEGVVGVPALDRPSLSVAGDDDDDDDEDGGPSVVPSPFTADVAAAKGEEKFEEKDEVYDDEEDEE